MVKEKVLGKGSKVSLYVTDNEGISKINKKFLNRDGPTNVISFSYLDSVDPEGYIGDIVISLEKAEEEAKGSGMTLKERFIELFVHGLLHIYGFDHEREEERKIMEKLEEEIVKEVR